MAAIVSFTIKGGKLDGAEYVFAHPQRLLIGRECDCAIQLPTEKGFLTVSRHHCQLDIDPPHVTVRDCGSRNGSWINGMQIGRPTFWVLPATIADQPCQEYELHDHDELEVGGVVFDVRIRKVAEETVRDTAERESARAPTAPLAPLPATELR
jgi:pSer/pThr/pTyr-binding forkhead associated (FHA) protein